MASISEPNGPRVYPQCSDPWFNDGTIVLETEGTQFKVYQGILAANSSIFRDLFDIGQGDAEHVVEGCHVVQLSDKAEDLRIVLHSLHDCTMLKDHVSMDKKIPVNVLIAYLRLGRKYDIAYLSEIAMSKLDLEYPITLEARRRIIASSSIPWPRFIDIDRTKRGHFLMVNVIREHDILKYLPSALFICAAANPNDPREEKLWSLFSPNPAVNNDERYLSPMDHLACMRGQKIIGQLLFDETFSWMKSGHCPCGIMQCAEYKNSLLLHYVFPINIGWAVAAWDPKWECKLCPECITLCKDCTTQGAQNIWNQLPSLFGLPAWEEFASTCA